MTSYLKKRPVGCFLSIIFYRPKTAVICLTSAITTSSSCTREPVASEKLTVLLFLAQRHFLDFHVPQSHIYKTKTSLQMRQGATHPCDKYIQFAVVGVICVTPEQYDVYIICSIRLPGESRKSAESFNNLMFFCVLSSRGERKPSLIFSQPFCIITQTETFSSSQTHFWALLDQRGPSDF